MTLLPEERNELDALELESNQHELSPTKELRLNTLWRTLYLHFVSNTLDIDIDSF